MSRKVKAVLTGYASQPMPSPMTMKLKKRKLTKKKSKGQCPTCGTHCDVVTTTEEYSYHGNSSGMISGSQEAKYIPRRLPRKFTKPSTESRG